MSIVNDECKVNFVLSEILQFIILSFSTLFSSFIPFFLYFVPSFFPTTVFSPLLCFSQPSLSNHSFHKKEKLDSFLCKIRRMPPNGEPRNARHFY